MLPKTPTYNLRAVLKETGLTAATVRAWERRYGLPRPSRTPGGHRLYSPYELATLHWLKARIAEGLTISRAVDLWRQILATGRDPLADVVRPAPGPPAPTLEAARKGWVEACLGLDEPAAEQILDEAFSLHAVERICLGILTAGLAEIGELWFRRQATVQQEHFASQLATRRLDALLSTCPPPVRRETVLVASPPGEWHTFPLHVVSLLLRRRGYGVVYLGANVPLDRMLETVNAARPGLVILASQHLMSAARLREMAEALTQAGTPVAYGGRLANILPAVRARIPAYFLGPTIEEAIPCAERLLAGGGWPLSAEPAPPEAKDLAERFRRHRSQVEAAVNEALVADGETVLNLETANVFLGGMLAAALELGAQEFLALDLAWISHMLPAADIDRQALPRYLRRYAQAARRVIGEPIAAAADWLERTAADIEAPADDT